MDKLAKEAIKAEHVDIQVPLSKTEIKVNDNINRMWQDIWDQEKRKTFIQHSERNGY